MSRRSRPGRDGGDDHETNSQGYAQSFQLEPTKLTRILDKIHERLEEHASTTKRDHFEVFMSGSRRVEDVLKLENSRRHKIQRLLIVCSATAGTGMNGVESEQAERFRGGPRHTLIQQEPHALFGRSITLSSSAVAA
jgi:hypothetical protein